MSEEIISKDEVREADREQVRCSLIELRPFIRYRSELEAPEQIAATLAAIVSLVDGQTFETACAVLDGARESYANILAARELSKLRKGEAEA